MFNLKFERNGYVSAEEICTLMESIADILAERFHDLDRELEANTQEIKALKEELATERRLRLSMARRGAVR